MSWFYFRPGLEALPTSGTILSPSNTAEFASVAYEDYEKEFLTHYNAKTFCDWFNPSYDAMYEPGYSIRQRIDTTFIYVTHDQTEAMTLGDRIVIMKDGYIMQIGTPQEVFEHPANIFVAGFIGSPQMNFFDARLQKTGAGYQAAVAGAVMPLSDRIQQRLAEKGYGDQDVILGIRPEHIAFALTPGEHFVAAKVDVSEMMGLSLIHI